MRSVACLAPPGAPGRLAVIGWLLGMVVWSGAACRGRAGSPGPSAAAHVDSAISWEEALRRFQAGLTAPSSLEGGATSRDLLVREFVEALAARDTARLLALEITRSEFAYLYYPTTPQSFPPYDLSPALLWFLVSENSRKGLMHALEERGGKPLRFVGYTCDGKPSVEAANRIWGPCMVRRVVRKGDTASERLFSRIIEREGRFKFLSYSNKL